MGTMGEELQTLRTRAEEAARLESELKEAEDNSKRLEGLYQVEQASNGVHAPYPALSSSVVALQSSHEWCCGRRSSQAKTERQRTCVHNTSIC